MDDKLLEYINSLTDSSDSILMGRKMTDEFINYWTSVLENAESPEYAFARKMVDIPKVVFTKTLDESAWPNTVLAKGDIVEELNQLKNQPGKDLIAMEARGSFQV